jgi:hypothetical protein
MFQKVPTHIPLLLTPARRKIAQSSEVLQAEENSLR